MKVEDGIVVLSLFDGMSCGRLALERTGINVKTYYASEIDKYAMQVTNHNFSDTIQLGDVKKIDCSSLPKIDLLQGGSPCQSFSFVGKRKGMSTKCEVDILSLDQYLELKRNNFEFEGQSYLFWEFVRILKEATPRFFFLENVMMEEKWKNLITKTLGVRPVRINSALVSAQNRERLYWFNFGLQPSGLFGDLHSIVEQPKDRGILLKDVLETDVHEKYYISTVALNRILNKANFTPQVNPEKTGTLNTKNNSGQLSVDNGTTLITDNAIGRNVEVKNAIKSPPLRSHNGCAHDNKVVDNRGVTHNQGVLSESDKSNCIDANYYKGMDNHGQRTMIVASRGRNPDNPKSRESGLPTEQQLEPRTDGKTNCLTSVQKDNLVYQETTTPQDHPKIIQVNPSTESGGTQPYQTNRIYDPNGTSPCLNVDQRSPAIIERGTRQIKLGKSEDYQREHTEEKSYCLETRPVIGVEQQARIRRLTEMECERLQTVPDGYTNHVSSTQRYKMLGNGWNIDTIVHIYQYLKKEL